MWGNIAIFVLIFQCQSSVANKPGRSGSQDLIDLASIAGWHDQRESTSLLHSHLTELRPSPVFHLRFQS